MAERALRFDLVANAAKFTRGMRDAQRSTERFNRHTNQAGRALKTAFAAFSAGAAVMEMRKWVGAARDANRVAAQTNAVIKSTRGATGLSAKGFADLAKQIMRTTAVDDDLIQGGENILATFTKIKAGGPEKIFERATAAAVDLTAGLNQGQVSAEGLKSANLLLGKALQDPIAGLGKLQRAGVSFSAAQKEQIKRFVEHGQVAKAQGVIISEVNRQFGGSAAAAVTPAKRLAVTWGNMQEVLGNLLIPAIDRGAVVMTDILEVIDRNRTAFGLLFGILAAGAAIVGTLVLAEKVHRAVVDATKVATASWTAVQKGANLVLGTTKVQATTTAVAQGELAAATTASGTAAGAAAGKWALLGTAMRGTLIPLAALAVGMEATSRIQERATGQHERGIATFLRTTGVLSPLADLIPKYGKATKDAGEATKGNADALGELLPKQQAAAEKTAAVTQKTAELTGKLKALKDGFKDQVATVRDAIQSYDGLITKSDVTTKEVIADIRNQVSNFKTYSRDVQRLIKAGVNPAAIEELSRKGPQFVHALATGSNRELQIYKGHWAARQKEIRTSFAASMQTQLEGLVRKIKAMQREIDKLKGKTITVAAALKLTFSPSFSQKDWAQVRIAAGRMAKGGRITKGTGPTADDVLARLSRGETVVPAADSDRPEFKAWAALRGIPGFAAGGPVGRINEQARAVNKVQAWGTGRRMDAGLTKLMKLLGGGSPAIKAFIRSTDPLPYIWGGAGPGGYDCSGLVGAVAAAHARRPYGHGQRYFTTSSIRPGILGIKSGLGGVLQIGVTAGTGHMAGRYGGLGFEAESTRTGIKVGAAASRPESFARHFHLAKGGRVDPAMVARFAALAGADIGGDPGRLRVNGKVFDSGGWLHPGTTVASNRTGRSEPVGFDYDRLGAAVAGPVAAAVAQVLHGTSVQLDGQAVGALVVEPQFRDLRRLLTSSGRPNRGR